MALIVVRQTNGRKENRNAINITRSRERSRDALIRIEFLRCDFRAIANKGERGKGSLCDAIIIIIIITTTIIIIIRGESKWVGNLFTYVKLNMVRRIESFSNKNYCL